MLTMTGNSSGTGSFVMDFTTYPRASWRDQWTPTRPFEQVTGNQPHEFGRFLPWQNNSESPQLDIQGSTNNNPSPSTDISSGEFFSGASDSSCALSLLSSQPCNAKGQSLNIGSNYELNTDTSHMVQPTAVHVAHIDHFSNSSWGNETGTSSLNMHSDSSLGQITQPGNRVYAGELQLNQQRGRPSTSLEQSTAYYSSPHNMHWSI